MSVKCDYCHGEIASDTPPVTCSVCRTAHRYDESAQRFVAITSAPQVFEYSALVALVGGVACHLASNVPPAPGWLLVFIGFAIHLWNGWRTGVIRWNLGQWPHTAYREEDPMAFRMALLMKGAFTLLFLCIFFAEL